VLQSILSPIIYIFVVLIPLFHEKLLNLMPFPSVSTKNGPISCVAPYPTEEQPGPIRTKTTLSP
jgi:hypothetical protein